MSVVIPTRDRPRSLPVALASVLAQDGDLEVIVIDDGSEPAVVAAGLLSDPRVRLLRNHRAQGPTKARNAGIRAAAGAFIGFLDDDDVWLPGKLGRCLAVAAVAPRADVIVHRTVYDRREVGSGGPSPVRVLANPLRQLGREQTPHLNGLIVRTSLAKHVGFDESLDAAEDVDFVIELARRARFAVITDVLAVSNPANGISMVGMDRRIAARQRLRDKHGDVLYADAASRSFYHLRLGHLYRRSGHRREALRNFATSIRFQAGDPAPWRALGLTLLPVSTSSNLSMARRVAKAEHR